MISSVLFDLDGTLLDTPEGLTDSVCHVLGKHGYPPVTVSEVKRFSGNGAAELLKLCIAEEIEDALFERMLEEYKFHYAENCAGKSRPYPGIMEMLETLKKNGIEMAVVSNKPTRAVEALSGVFFPALMTASVGETDGIMRKPAPDLVFLTIDKMKGGKETALYVGDSEVDVLTAKNAGISCVCVSWGFRSREELLSAGAEIIVDSPLELCQFILENR